MGVRDLAKTETLVEGDEPDDIERAELASERWTLDEMLKRLNELRKENG